jgi:biopolymer transport protein ExbD
MPLKTHLDEQPTLNLTPMIDIVFLLIIFFMVGSTFGGPERKIDLSVPEVAKHESLDSPPSARIVNVSRDGTITLDDVPLTPAELTGQLSLARAANPNLPVLIRGDKKVPYERVVWALDACKRAGVRQLDVSVQLIKRR